MDHKKYILAAMNEAKKSISEGNQPFGAVIVSPEGKIVSRAHDTIKTSHDPSSHAELSAVRKLCRKTKNLNLKYYYCYSTSEPCVMCMASCLKAGINNFYYGAPMEKSASLYIKADYTLSKFRKFKVNVVGGILKYECLKQRKGNNLKKK